MRPRLRLAGFALLAALCVPAIAIAQADAQPSLRRIAPGPTRAARTMTAHDLVTTGRDDLPIPILPRYHAFERDLATAFGAPIGGGPTAFGGDLFVDVRRWFVTRWGESSFYRWVEGALETYDRVQDGATLERRGFDMRWNMDEMAGGRLGLEVRRPLD